MPSGPASCWGARIARFPRRIRVSAIRRGATTRIAVWGKAISPFATADPLAGENKDWRKRERASFLTGILTSSLAPSNTLLGNPAALKRAFKTAGRSLLAGAKNMVGDLIHNKGMPSQVDKSAFKVGENLAATPGAVVFRNEMVELMQYQPMTPEVCDAADADDRAADRQVLLHGPGAEAQLRRVRGLARRADVCHQLAQSRTRTRATGASTSTCRPCLDLVDAVCEIAGSDKLNSSGCAPAASFPP